MARKHRHMVAYRVFFVVAIPAMYYLCVNVNGNFRSAHFASNPEVAVASGRPSANLRFRRSLEAAAPTLGAPLDTRNGGWNGSGNGNDSDIGDKAFRYVNSNVSESQSADTNCTPPAIREFPSDGLTRAQRRAGWIAIHFLVAIYAFLLLAVVCDDFFVPSIKKICERINVTEDVAGATVMAAASSSPELFVNVIGTFVTEGDLGVGTIVGSAVFNVLAVPACCGLFANQVLDLEPWPVTRDTIAYAFTVLLLILTLRDGRVEWYEALVLVAFYVLYISAMCFNRRIGNFFKRARGFRGKYENMCEESPLIPKTLLKDVEVRPQEAACGDHCVNDESLDIVDMTSWPSTFSEKLWWVATWPINFVLLITIPDCRRPSLQAYFPLTFLMCIVWIGSTSYVVGWVITVIGDAFMIPDSIMGLTFLAAGMSVPEAVSSVIVANQGHGAMGISNSIGSNVFDVLLCLGLPWFVKAAILPSVPGERFVKINSQGLVYSSISLFSTLFVLYVSLAIAKFKLTRSVGIACLVMYLIFLAFASVLELNTFFVVNLPTCVD